MKSFSQNTELKNRIYVKYIKRSIGFIIALVFLVLTLPLLLLGAILIKIDDNGPILFKQKRIGYKGKEFTIYKIRSMKLQEYDEVGRKLRDKERVTKAGKFVRRTSIDELPQLLNILLGDMSFIGPRPLLVRYLPYYTDEELHRHDVRPGITGLAQINGRSNLGWSKRFEYDIEYVKNISLMTDIKIILKTIVKVFQGKDTSVMERPKNFQSLDIERKDMVKK